MNTKEQLETYLTEHGYADREEVNVWEQGLTVIYHKESAGLRLTFSYWWESQGFEPFWRGELTIITQLYVPAPKYMHPIGVIRIDNIIAEYLHDLPKMEGYLRNLFKVEPSTI